MNPGRRDELPEKRRRRIRQLVRLIENHRIGRRQQFRHPRILQHYIGEKQMVVDYHHVSLLRRLARLHHETVLIMRTLRPLAILFRGSHLIPDRRRLRHRRQIRLVTRFRHLGEADDFAQIIGIGPRLHPAVFRRARQMERTDIIGAPLEQRHRHRRGQGLPHGRNIAEKKLVLQIARPGGHDHLAAPHQRRHQISEGLARTRSRLGDECLAIDDRPGDRLCHLQLHRPVAVALDDRSQRPVDSHQTRQILLIRREVIRPDQTGRRFGIHATLRKTNVQPARYRRKTSRKTTQKHRKRSAVFYPIAAKTP